MKSNIIKLKDKVYWALRDEKERLTREKNVTITFNDVIDHLLK